MSEFENFELMKLQGIEALEAYRTARSTGLDQIVAIRMLRSVYGLSLDDAKKVSFKGDTGKEYEQQNGKFVDEYTKIIDDELGPL